MVKPSSSLRSCSSKKRKRKSKAEAETETTEVEEGSMSLLRSCSSKERRENITDDVEEDKEKKKKKQKQKQKQRKKKKKQKQNIDGDGGCKMIRDGCDFLCAEELGKQFLLCGGRYHRYHSSKKSVVSIRQVLLHKKSVVAILFVDLTNPNIILNSNPNNGELHFLKPLKEVYYQLKQQHDDGFEIVFVANFSSSRSPSYDDDEVQEDIFNSHLNQMPWLAVPFRDHKNWRKHLLKRYNQECPGFNSDLIIFGPNGHLLQPHKVGEGLENLIHFYGPDFYPFTDAKEKELIDKYFAPLRSPHKSLEALLGRDFLISSGDGDGHVDYKRVPISQLQGKVVGLYFFHKEQEKHQNRDFMRMLEDFRLRALSERGSSFEIVFINVDFEFGFSSERSFRRFLNKWPWLLALPFKDDKIRGLTYVLSIAHSVNSLVIIDAGDDGGNRFLIDPHGYDIIQEYGFDAYPFTRDMAISAAKKRLTQLTLADFFKATRTEFLSRRSSSKGKPDMPLSFLQNKRVLLYIANSRRRREIRKLLDLQKKDKSFEVLVFDSERTNAMTKNWVAFPPGVYLWELADKTVKVNIDCSNYFIAFDDTGKLLKMGGMELLKKDSCAAAFPYITDETFDNEFRQMLIHKKDWNYEVGDE